MNYTAYCNKIHYVHNFIRIISIYIHTYIYEKIYIFVYIYENFVILEENTWNNLDDTS